MARQCGTSICKKISIFAVITSFWAIPSFSGIVAAEGQENLNRLATASNHFALNLYQTWLKERSLEGTNVVFSPLSLSLALGMLYYGARRDTAKELRNTLGFDKADLTDETIRATLAHFLSQVLTKNSSEGYTMRSVNAVLVDKRFGLSPEYRKEVRSMYRARIRSVNFAKRGPKIVDLINRWVKRKTNGKIDQLLENLSSDTAMVILNAVYFLGSWKYPFDPRRTTLRSFYNDGQESQAKLVNTMTMEARFPYGSVSDCQILELPYKGDHISMLILLPKEKDGLPALEKDFSLEKLNAIRKNMDSVSSGIKIQLPKFKLEFSRDIASDLLALNITSIAGPRADFSGMVEHEGISVSEVVHKATIEVDEVGTEAAAVTKIRIGKSRLESFFADHPFLFIIMDKRNDLLLFMGRVNNL